MSQHDNDSIHVFAIFHILLWTNSWVRDKERRG